MKSKDEVVCIHQGFWLITNGGGFVQGKKPQYGQIYVVEKVEDGLWLEGFPNGSWATECFVPLSEWSILNDLKKLSAPEETADGPIKKIEIPDEAK
jgi:hypothetical protein